LDLGNKHLPGRLEELLNVGLASVAGVDKLEALLLRIRFPSSGSAEHFAGAFCCGAGGSSPLPLGRARSVVSFRLRCGLQIRVARSRDPDDGSELTFLEGFELRHRAKHLDKKFECKRNNGLSQDDIPRFRNRSC
jgi:hypothetical protein